MSQQEIPLLLDCQGEQMIAVLHQPCEAEKRGVLIVVGGPQYRVGSHRQFILLARYLADEGIPVLRFDHRGMGDSQGQSQRFDNLDMDIAAAVDGFFQHQPDLAEIVIWGLCDGASAAAFYAHQDQRIRGLVLLNPWVHTDQGAAKTLLKNYYWQRLCSADFWHKVSRGSFDMGMAARSLGSILKQALSRQSSVVPIDESTLNLRQLPLPERVRASLEAFQYPLLFILSGQDLTADEFRNVVSASSDWKRLLARSQVSCYDLPEADHTFSQRTWRQQVEQRTFDWVALKDHN